VVTREVDEVTNNWSTRNFLSEDELYACLSEFEKNPRWGIRAAIEVWRLDEDDPILKSTPLTRDTLPTILQRLSLTAQHMLYRGRPVDWPCLFYAICNLG